MNLFLVGNLCHFLRFQLGNHEQCVQFGRYAVDAVFVMHHPEDRLDEETDIIVPCGKRDQIICQFMERFPNVLAVGVSLQNGQ